MPQPEDLYARIGFDPRKAYEIPDGFNDEPSPHDPSEEDGAESGPSEPSLSSGIRPARNAPPCLRSGSAGGSSRAADSPGRPPRSPSFKGWRPEAPRPPGAGPFSCPRRRRKPRGSLAVEA